LVQDIIGVCTKKPLTIPTNYFARSDLLMPLAWTSIKLPSCILVLDRCSTGCYSSPKRWMSSCQHKKKWKQGGQKVCEKRDNPFTLFRLLEVSQLHDGCRIIYRDGTHCTLVDGAKLIVHMVSPDVQECPSQNNYVTSKGLIPY
jgi:hypothetical protein